MQSGERRGSQRAGQRLLGAPVRVFLVVLVITAIGAGVRYGGGISLGNTSVAPLTETSTGTYTNPLSVETTTGGAFESCPDPAVIKGQAVDDPFWYLYCTSNPLNGNDRTTTGRLNNHLVATLQSRDLVHWAYVGDAFLDRPAWVSRNALFWAPDIQYFNGQYYLYYTTTDTLTDSRGSAIGVATSANPTGPWVDSGGPVVESQPWSGRRFGRWVYDPTVVADADGQRYLFYGSFVGGISARRLSPDGLHATAVGEVQITVSGRYEGASVVRHGNYYYLFASSSECCNGALSGYSVFVGRATKLLGPYTDHDGVALLGGPQVGGTPVLSANGNRWVGPGHNTVITDRAGQDWIIYHAVDRTSPYFTSTPSTKRPLLMDTLDWADGWPVVHGGLGPSDGPQPAPAARPGDAHRALTTVTPLAAPGIRDDALSVDFGAPLAGIAGQGSAFPSGQWRWVRPPIDNTISLDGGALRFATQAGTLDDRAAGVLTEPTPLGDYTVEARLRLDAPSSGCCAAPTQAGLTIYGDDGNYLTLVAAARDGMAQTVFAKRISEGVGGSARTGTSVVGAPATVIYLRITKHTRSGVEAYTAYTSRDGKQWVQGATWTHELGRTARIGLVAMGGEGYTARFDYVRVFTLPPSVS